MRFASKYSHILLRIILSSKISAFAPKFRLLSCTAAQFLSDLLQHKETYPFNLTGTCPDKNLKIPLNYKLAPLELSCYHWYLPEFRVLVEHTPLVPTTGYIAAIAQFRGRYNVNPAEFFDELIGRGADVNALLNPLLQNTINGIRLESTLGNACLQYNGRISSMALIEWLLSKNAKFSANELAEIERRPDLEGTNHLRELTLRQDVHYIPLSIPIINWQGPTLKDPSPTDIDSTEAYAILLLYDVRRIAPSAVYSITFYAHQRCEIGLASGFQYNCTWKTNENDNVITIHAHSLVSNVDEPISINFEFRVFKAFNGSALLVTEEHLKQQNGTFSWLCGVIGDSF